MEAFKDPNEPNILNLARIDWHGPSKIGQDSVKTYVQNVRDMDAKRLIWLRREVRQEAEAKMYKEITRFFYNPTEKKHFSAHFKGFFDFFLKF